MGSEMCIRDSKSADGELMILNVQPVPKAHTIFDSLPSTPDATDKPETSKKCNLYPAFLCKVEQVIDSAIANVKTHMPKVDDVKHTLTKLRPGCHGKKLPGHLRPHINAHGSETDGRPEHHRGHGSHGQHRGHHGHHHAHHAHKLLEGFAMIMVPIMTGISLGITSGIVGMLVGRLIGFLWIKFARGGRRGYASVAQAEVEAEEGEFEGENEKVDGPVEVEAEPLPRYEDAPAYEETETE